MSIEKMDLTLETQKCRIAWKSKITGATGNGEFMNKATAEAWLEKANKEHPDLEHWLESKDEAK